MVVASLYRSKWLALVVMPQKQRSCGAIRRPRLSELPAFPSRWPVIELTKPSKGNLQRKVICGKDVPAIQREHEVNLRTPSSESAELHNSFDGFFIAQ